MVVQEGRSWGEQTTTHPLTTLHVLSTLCAFEARKGANPPGAYTEGVGQVVPQAGYGTQKNQRAIDLFGGRVPH